MDVELEPLDPTRPQAQPRVVKTSTAGRELVEVDGFTFIRKRAVEQVPQPAADNQHATVTCGTGDTTNTQQPHAEVPARLSSSLQQQHDTLPLLTQPTPLTQDAEDPHTMQLTDTAPEALAGGRPSDPDTAAPTTDAAGPGPLSLSPPRPTATDTIPAMITAPASDDATVTPPAMTPHKGAAQGEVVYLDVTPVEWEDEEGAGEEEVPSLHEQLLSCLPASCPTITKVQVMVTQLLQQRTTDPLTTTELSDTLDRSDQATVDLAAQQVATVFCSLLGSAVTSARQLLLDLPSQPTAANSEPAATPAATYQQLAPMLREAAEGPGLRAALLDRLAALQQEEAAWKRVVYEPLGSGSSGAPLPTPANTTAVATPAMSYPGSLAALVSMAEEVVADEQAPLDMTIDMATVGTITTPHDSNITTARHTTTAATDPAPMDVEMPAVTGSGVTASVAGDVAAATNDSSVQQPVMVAQTLATSVQEAVAVTGAEVEVSGGRELEGSVCEELEVAAVQAVSTVEATVLHMEGVINKAGLVLNKAQQAAAELQAAYHAGKFEGLPAETPRALIKNIAAAPAARMDGDVLQLATPL